MAVSSMLGVLWLIGIQRWICRVLRCKLSPNRSPLIAVVTCPWSLTYLCGVNMNFVLVYLSGLQGESLAVGTTTGSLEIWDVATTKLTRRLKRHDHRVGEYSRPVSMSWSTSSLHNRSLGCMHTALYDHLKPAWAPCTVVVQQVMNSEPLACTIPSHFASFDKLVSTLSLSSSCRFVTSASMAWNKDTLATGSRDQNIFVHDLRYRILRLVGCRASILFYHKIWSICLPPPLARYIYSKFGVGVCSEFLQKSEV